MSTSSRNASGKLFRHLMDSESVLLYKFASPVGILFDVLIEKLLPVVILALKSRKQKQQLTDLRKIVHADFRRKVFQRLLLIDRYSAQCFGCNASVEHDHASGYVLFDGLDVAQVRDKSYPGSRVFLAKPNLSGFKT